MTVYGAMGLMSFLLVIPVTPFTLKIHRWITSVFALAFVVLTVYNLVAFPFSQDVPLKVYFKQKIAVDIANPNHGIIQPLTTLVGATQYLEDFIVSELPSSWRSSVSCQGYQSSPRLSICSWESPLLPSPIKSDATEGTARWLETTTSRLTPTSALISVKGTNTRVCRLYFDNRRIRFYQVYDVGAGGALFPLPASQVQSAYPIPKEGLDWMWLWSREWNKTFVVEVAWDADDEVNANVTTGLSGRVACEWAEYESGTVGLTTNPATGAIPAYEEVLNYLPSWAVASKVSGGLVEVFGQFTV